MVVILIVVAHPDDEVLWFGGGIRILMGKGLPIGILSTTNKSNATRKAEFENACHVMGTVPIMADLPDGARTIWNEPLKSIDEALLSAGIHIDKLTVVITHSPFGNERQHPQHIVVSNVIQEWALNHDVDVAFFSEFPLTKSFGKSDANFDGMEFICRPSKFSIWSFVRNFPRIIWMQKENFIVKLIRISEVFSMLRIYRGLKNYNQVCRFKIDLEWKATVMKCYISQIDGLQKYCAYTAKYDYLYIKSSSINEVLFPKPE